MHWTLLNLQLCKWNAFLIIILLLPLSYDSEWMICIPIIFLPCGMCWFVWKQFWPGFTMCKLPVLHLSLWLIPICICEWIWHLFLSSSLILCLFVTYFYFLFCIFFFLFWWCAARRYLEKNSGVYVYLILKLRRQIWKEEISYQKPAVN